MARLRKKKSLTQEGLAGALPELGWTQQTVARIEKGKRSLRLAEAIELSSFFDVTVETLVSGTLDVTIEQLKVRQGEAEFMAKDRSSAAARYAEQIRRLQRLERAAKGETIDLGADPQRDIYKTFLGLPWPEVSAILSSLGVPEATLDALAAHYGDARKMPDGDPVLFAEILLALQVALPTLEPRPE